MISKKAFVLLSGLLFLVPTSLAVAAAPDGAGPWADSVISTAQGLRKDGSPVAVSRSNPSAALGVAENTNADGTFYSLGFGGDIVLKFDNPISNGVVIVEATNHPYPSETAKIELSADGVHWLLAGTVSEDGSVPMPERLSCARYARVTDTSDKALFENTADGYDVDGVRATDGVSCDTPPAPEFGTITGILATLGSVGTYLAMKRKEFGV